MYSDKGHMIWSCLNSSLPIILVPTRGIGGTYPLLNGSTYVEMRPRYAPIHDSYGVSAPTRTRVPKRYQQH
jgi:hypothetical protein